MQATANIQVYVPPASKRREEEGKGGRRGERRGGEGREREGRRAEWSRAGQHSQSPPTECSALKKASLPFSRTWVGTQVGASHLNIHHHSSYALAQQGPENPGCAEEAGPGPSQIAGFYFDATPHHSYMFSGAHNHK